MKQVIFFFVVLAAVLHAGPYDHEIAQIRKLDFSRDLCIDTALVKNGIPAAVIVPGKTDLKCAEIINNAIREHTGITLPLAAKIPASGNVIVLGNRDRNEAMEDLYNRHYTLLDARYPGKDGAVSRSLHNPFGDKRNFLLAGGSDPAGDLLAAQLLAKRIAAQPAGKELKLGYFADLKYGKHVKLPRSVQEAIPANISPGGHVFGWNTLSGNLALFYITGDTHFAREFLRFAFPDRAASEEILKNDGPFGVGNMKNPLGEPYHYNGYYQTLYWDLVEEHPFFTPEIRAKVTAKFYEALLMRKLHGDKGIYKTFHDRKVLPRLGDRHWLAEALQVYSLARYFDKYYDFPLGKEGMRVSRRYFKTLDQYAAINAGSLIWYASFLQPAVHFALLDRGVDAKKLVSFRTYVENMMLLANGKKEDWAIQDSSYQLMNILGYLAQDQAPLTLAKLLAPPEGTFLLGQSHEQGREYPRNFFRVADGCWNTAAFDPRGMPEWDPPFAREKVVEWLNYRKLGPGGQDDFALVDAKFESGRNAFHNFAVIELFIGGKPVLLGYSNQLEVLPNGLAKPELPLYTEILAKGRTGKTGYLQGKVADFNGCEWTRTFVMRDHRFLLMVDEFKPLDPEKTDFIAVANPFHFPPQAYFNTGKFGFHLRSAGQDWTIDCSEEADLRRVSVSGGMMKAGNKAAEFYITGPGKGFRMATIIRPGKSADTPSSARSGDHIALRLPERAMLDLLPDGGFLLREKGRIFAFRAKELPGVFLSSLPVSAEWDGKTLQLCAENAVKIQLADGKSLYLPAGKTVSTSFAGNISGPDPDGADRILAGKKPVLYKVDAPELKKEKHLLAGCPIGVSQMVEIRGEKFLAAASGKRLFLLDAQGGLRREIAVPSPIGSFAWFAEKEQFLIGSLDEKVRAVNLNGQEVWQFQSQMSDEAQWQGQWWAKCSIPGVRGITVARLAGGKTYLVIGGASVVEILSPEGKLLSRRFMPWGTFKKCTVMENSMLCWGYMVSHPNVYRFDDSLKCSEMTIYKDSKGTWMGGFGFGYVGRSDLEYTSLQPGKAPVLIGSFNGTMNRIMIWDVRQNVRHEAALGFGIRAFGAPFGTPMLRSTNIRGFALPDFQNDGNKTIAVGYYRNFVALFDHELKLKRQIPLPAAPRLLTALRGPSGDRLAAACDDGRIYIIDGTGNITAQAQITARPTLLAGWGDTLFAGSEKDGITLFQLP